MTAESLEPRARGRVCAAIGVRPAPCRRWVSGRGRVEVVRRPRWWHSRAEGDSIPLLLVQALLVGMQRQSPNDAFSCREMRRGRQEPVARCPA
eukprot:6194987-Pleurochrysis_carterae.AAC.1